MIRWTVAFASLVALGAVVRAQDKPKDLPVVAAPRLTVPSGAAPKLDGTVNEDEWRGAAVFTVGQGGKSFGQAWIRRHERQLYIGFNSKFAPYALGIRFNITEPGSGRKAMVLVTPLNPPRSPLNVFREVADRPATQMSSERCDVRFDLSRDEGFSFELRIPLDLIEVARAAKTYLFNAEVWDLQQRKTLAWFPVVVEKSGMGGRGDAEFVPVGDWGAGVAPGKLAPLNKAVQLLEAIEAEALSQKGRILRAFTGINDGQRKDAPLAKLEKDLTGLIAEYPGYLSLRANLIRVLRARNNFDGALKAMRTIPRDFPFMRHNPYNTLAQVEMMYALGEYDPAIALVEKDKDVLGPDELQRMQRLLHGIAATWKIERKIRKAEAKLDNLPRVLLKTTRGDIVVELFEDDAPNGVANFITLVENGNYDGTRFHGVSGGGAVFGGDPNSRNDNPFDDGLGDAGYKIESEPSRRLNFPFTLAFADKRSPKRTESCTFMIHIKPAPELDGTNTVFGRVVDGLDVVKRLEYYDRIEKATVVRKRDHAYNVVKR